MTRFSMTPGRSFPQFVAICLLLGIGIYSESDFANKPDDPVSLDIAFVTHLDMDLPEQDVYIEREPGSDEVYRVTTGDHNMKGTALQDSGGNQARPVQP